MKWYGILALVFALFALGGIVYLGMNAEKFGFEKSDHMSSPTMWPPAITTYDCDKNYNKYLKLFDYVDGTESIAAKSPERMAIYELEEELIDNGCI